MHDTPEIPPETPSGPGPDILDEVRALRAEVEQLNQQRFFRMETSFWQIAFWSAVRGLSFGLGSVLGATILLSILLRMLSSIDFIPVLGEWAQQIVNQIEPPPAN